MGVWAIASLPVRLAPARDNVQGGFPTFRRNFRGEFERHYANVRVTTVTPFQLRRKPLNGDFWLTERDDRPRPDHQRRQLRFFHFRIRTPPNLTEEQPYQRYQSDDPTVGPRVLSTGAPAALPIQQNAGASFIHPSHAAAVASQTGRAHRKIVRTRVWSFRFPA
jgi:hypothetical protein